MSMETDSLLVGATRPTFVGGITYEAIIFCGMISSIIFLAANNVFLLPAVYIPLHAISYLICLKDPRAFRLMALWVNTKARSISMRFWGAATASPWHNTRKQKGKGF